MAVVRPRPAPGLRAGAIALLASCVGIAAVLCIVSLRSGAAQQSTELLYGHTNNWGGFLASRHHYPGDRQPNSLTKQDLALLKVAHSEEIEEKKDGLLSKKHDEAALKEREARHAKLKALQAKLHKQQLASVPAPYKKHAAPSADHLTHKDQQLLKIAENEMVSETKKAIDSKNHDMQAEKLREVRKAEERKKAAAAKAKAAHAAHAAKAVPKHAKAPAAHLEEHTWGGFLPRLHKKLGPGELDAKAQQLLQSAERDQQNDTKMGDETRERDQIAYKKMYVRKNGFANDPRVRSEASREFSRIERKASVGLERATADDDSEAAHAWGHV